MIAVRLTEEYQERLSKLAREARMKPGPYARRILIAYIESQADWQTDVLAKLARIEQCIPQLARPVLRLEDKLNTFLENAELTDPR